MKILVTGATGFIGSHIVQGLAQNGYELVILKRSSTDTWRIKNLINKLKSYDADKSSIRTILDKEGVDLIIHTATNYGRKGEPIEDIIQSNIQFPSVLIDAAINSGLKGFINTDTSTVDTYSFYSSTKKALLMFLNYFHKEKGLKIINLQLEYVYGPLDDDSKFIPYLIKNVLADQPVQASEGMQKRDFLFVYDVAHAYLKAVQQVEKIGSEFITIEIGSGNSITLREFAAAVELLTHKKAQITWGALPYRKSEIFDSVANLEKAKMILNWQPQYSLTEGLKKTIEWYAKTEH